ncbi:hypothetical protein DFH06DRAFT_1332742 [Mycena polygramma]|nr:hypothetical protein DFH06DRAFT_1332742 [Mycena polygramma]
MSAGRPADARCVPEWMMKKLGDSSDCRVADVVAAANNSDKLPTRSTLLLALVHPIRLPLSYIFPTRRSTSPLRASPLDAPDDFLLAFLYRRPALSSHAVCAPRSRVAYSSSQEWCSSAISLSPAGSPALTAAFTSSACPGVRTARYDRLTPMSTCRSHWGRASIPTHRCHLSFYPRISIHRSSPTMRIPIALPRSTRRPLSSTRDSDRFLIVSTDILHTAARWRYRYTPRTSGGVWIDSGSAWQGSILSTRTAPTCARGRYVSSEEVPAACDIAISRRFARPAHTPAAQSSVDTLEWGRCDSARCPPPAHPRAQRHPLAWFSTAAVDTCRVRKLRQRAVAYLARRVRAHTLTRPSPSPRYAAQSTGCSNPRCRFLPPLCARNVLPTKLPSTSARRGDVEWSGGGWSSALGSF